MDKIIVGAALLALAGAAWAPDILHAYYDPRSDAIVAQIAYRGERPGHDYIVQWGECKDGGVTGRLVDLQGEEPAKTGFRVTQRLTLERLPCRPAQVTLRLGRVAHSSVHVPR